MQGWYEDGENQYEVISSFFLIGGSNNFIPLGNDGLDLMKLGGYQVDLS